MIKVDTRELNKLVVSLKNVHRAALPNAVRFTLNDLAFDVKKNTLVNAVKETMIVRNEPFFKKYSGVEKATGWDIREMKSQVGMMPSGSATEAVERLKTQDEGGTLKHEAIPLNEARIGKTERGKVKKQAYRKNMKFWGDKIKEGDIQGLIKAVTVSKISSGGKGKGNVVIYGKYVYEIVAYKKLSRNKIKIFLTQLYEYIPQRNVNLRPRKFTTIAGNESVAKTQEFFRINAEKQMKKFSNR